MIAVVGEVGPRAGAARALGRLAGVETGHADQPAVQADLARVPPRGHRHPGPRRGHRRRLADDDGRARARSRAGSSCSRRPRRSRRPAPRSSAAARSSRGPARTLPGPRRRGARYLAEARERTGLPVITEVMEPSQVDIVAEYADILQIGARNMQNYSLLTRRRPGARPVMLKRGYGATIEELLMAAEYIVSSGNPNVILCERGIRTFETYTRNTLDLAAVPLAPPADPPAGHRRPEPRDRQALAGQAARRWAASRSGPTGSWSRSTRTRTRRCPTPSSSSTSPVRRHDGRPRPGPRAGPLPARRRRTAGRRACAMSGLAARRPRALPTRPSSERAARLRGELDLPGDKSISHRALLLAALARARAGSQGPATARTCARRPASWRRSGRPSSGSGRRADRRLPGRLAGRRRPASSRTAILDCGNSGTSLRLIPACSPGCR